MGGRGSPKDVTGFEPARSTCSTCGGVGSLGDSKVGCCDFGIDNSLVHGGEGGQIGGSGVSGKSAPWVGLCGSATRRSDFDFVVNLVSFPNIGRIFPDFDWSSRESF